MTCRVVLQGTEVRYHVEFRHNSHVRIFCEAGSPASYADLTERMGSALLRADGKPIGRFDGGHGASLPCCHVASGNRPAVANWADLRNALTDQNPHKADWG